MLGAKSGQTCRPLWGIW
jgi:hypothetical protein